MGLVLSCIVFQMTRIYTGTGDEGLTGLCNGARVSKTEYVVEALGQLDLLNSKIGVCLSNYRDLPLPIKGVLTRAQADLFSCGAIISRAEMNFSEYLINEMEKNIDFLQEQLPELKKFILPGGSAPASLLFELRAMARQTEISIWKVISFNSKSSIFRRNEKAQEHLRQSKRIAIYLNRFNDYLFVAARFVNSVNGEAEVTWN